MPGRIWHKVNFFKRSWTGLNSEFSFSWTSCLTKAEEPSLPYYLPIGGGRIIRFIPFPRVLVLCEMQSLSSWIWTCVAMSNFYKDNHYTTGTSLRYWEHVHWTCENPIIHICLFRLYSLNGYDVPFHCYLLNSRQMMFQTLVMDIVFCLIIETKGPHD